MCRILLVTSQRWPTTAMLAEALLRAGAEVGAVSPPGHPVRALRKITHHQAYSHPRRLALITKSIGDMAPDIVIPGDDDAALALHQLHRLAWIRGNETLVGLIERSLGDPAHFDTTLRKSHVIETMAAAGVPTPASTTVATLEALEAALADGGWPKVLKADGWSAGRGVYVVRDRAEAVAAWETIHRVVSLPTMVKDALRDSSFIPLYRSGAPRVMVQAFVTGQPVTRTVFCWQGQVIAGRSFEPVQTKAVNSHATVVRAAHLAEADAIVAEAARRFSLSGLHGFDFMRDEATGRLMLLEINPRVTSSAYTAPAGGASVAERLVRFLDDPASGPNPIDERDPIQVGERPIALFPQENERDPASTWLDAGAVEQQAPLHEPLLVLRCLKMLDARTLGVQAADLLKGRRRKLQSGVETALVRK